MQTNNLGHTTGLVSIHITKMYKILAKSLLLLWLYYHKHNPNEENSTHLNNLHTLLAMSLQLKVML